VTQQDHIEVLQELQKEASQARQWLSRSYEQCKAIDFSRELLPEELDALEALTSRFARLCDVLLQKIFRAIDRVEFEEGGTLIDALNRAEKRGIIGSVESVRELRELRNTIAHEYAVGNLIQLFRDVLACVPQLKTMLDAETDYVERYM